MTGTVQEVPSRQPDRPAPPLVNRALKRGRSDRAVLCAVGRGGAECELLLAAASQVAGERQQRLQLLSVVTPLPWHHRIGKYAAAHAERAVARSDELLSEAYARVPVEVTTTTMLRYGHPAEQILDELASSDYSLVVLGRGSPRVWLRRRAVGARLFATTSVPVLLVPVTLP